VTVVSCDVRAQVSQDRLIGSSAHRFTDPLAEIEGVLSNTMIRWPDDPMIWCPAPPIVRWSEARGSRDVLDMKAVKRVAGKT